MAHPLDLALAPPGQAHLCGGTSGPPGCRPCPGHRHPLGQPEHGLPLTRRISTISRHSRAHVFTRTPASTTHVFAPTIVAAHPPTRRYTLAGFPNGKTCAIATLEASRFVVRRTCKCVSRGLGVSERLDVSDLTVGSCEEFSDGGRNVSGSVSAHVSVSMDAAVMTHEQLELFDDLLGIDPGLSPDIGASSRASPNASSFATDDGGHQTRPSNGVVSEPPQFR
jgi:hypothetical protein